MANQSQKIYNTKQWKEIRARVLAEENHTCHWCGKKATQVDHLVELDRGGEPYERSNLVASCQPCNSRRGSQYQAKRNAARQQARRGQSGQMVFGAEQTLTPPPPSAVSETKRKAQKRSEPITADADLIGRIEPRLISAELGHESFGPLVAAWAERNLDGDLMDWQRLALDGQLQHIDGQLVHSESLVSVARQNGKSYGMAALIGWWISEGPSVFGRPQTVISAAHKLDRAFALFKDLAPILEARYNAKINWSYGRNFAEFPDGSRWFVTAATPQNAHGASADLVCLDEIWSIGPEVIFDAYRPTMTARPNPLMSMWSTAGDESSKVMMQLREQAIHAIDQGRRSSIYFAEWSPPPGSNLDDPASWVWANPALGTTITVDRLRRMAETPNRQAFMRAHCNVWISSAQSWLPPGHWQDLEVDDEMPPGGVLAVDSDLTDLRYVGVRVAPRSDGMLQAKTEFVVESAAQMWDHIHEVMADTSVRLTLTPGLAALCPLDLSWRMVTFGTQEMNLYTAIVRNMILERRLVHSGQMSLAEQVNRAVAGRTGATITLSSQKSPGPIEMARCMVAAAGFASAPVASVRKPMMGLSK